MAPVARGLPAPPLPTSAPTTSPTSPPTQDSKYQAYPPLAPNLNLPQIQISSSSLDCRLIYPLPIQYLHWGHMFLISKLMSESPPLCSPSRLFLSHLPVSVFPTAQYTTWSPPLRPAACGLRPTHAYNPGSSRAQPASFSSDGNKPKCLLSYRPSGAAHLPGFTARPLAGPLARLQPGRPLPLHSRSSVSLGSPQPLGDLLLKLFSILFIVPNNIFSDDCWMDSPETSSVKVGAFLPCPCSTPCASTWRLPLRSGRMNRAEGNPNSGLPVSQQLLVLPPPNTGKSVPRPERGHRASWGKPGSQQWGGFPKTNQRLTGRRGTAGANHWATPDF